MNQLPTLAHNQVVTALGHCDCRCHRGDTAACWCVGNAPTAHRINHNDAVTLMSSCRCLCHHGQPELCWCRDRTDTEWARALTKAEERAKTRRIQTGRLRSSDFSDPRVQAMLQRRKP